MGKTWQQRIFARAIGTGPARPVVGVQLTAEHVSAVRIGTGPGIARFERGRRLSLPSGGALGPALRVLAAEGLFVDARIHLSLPAGRYETVLVATPPAVPEEELRDALRWQLRGVLTYGPEEAAFDFLRLPAASDASPSSPQALLVIAARKSEIAQLVSPFYAAGLEVDVVDIPEMAQRNLAARGESTTCSAFLTFDETSCLLTVQLGDELCFARRMQLPGAGGLGDDEPEHLADRIATNVQRSLEVFARQSNLPEVADLCVGGHAHASLIARAIAEQAEVGTRVFDPLVDLAGIADITLAGEELSQGDVQLALGTALRGGAGHVSRAASSAASWLRPWKRAA